MLLREIAHARAGDKGNISNISVIAYDPKDFPALEKYVTVERVKAHLSEIVKGDIERFVLPSLGALNFVMRDALAGGVTRSLAMDAHGKTLSFAILSLDIPESP